MSEATAAAPVAVKTFKGSATAAIPGPVEEAVAKFKELTKDAPPGALVSNDSGTEVSQVLDDPAGSGAGQTTTFRFGVGEEGGTELTVDFEIRVPVAKIAEVAAAHVESFFGGPAPAAWAAQAATLRAAQVESELHGQAQEAAEQTASGVSQELGAPPPEMSIQDMIQAMVAGGGGEVGGAVGGPG